MSWFASTNPILQLKEQKYHETINTMNNGYTDYPKKNRPKEAIMYLKNKRLVSKE
jgi:hypothetical protein